MQSTDLMQQARRATAGRSVLGWVALTCLLLNGAFWGSLMLDLLAPPKLLSPQTIQAGLSIAAFALVLPLAWSSLLPNSPAMRLLQKQSWHLPGQIAIAASAVFLTYLAGSWLYLWWGVQPQIKASNSAMLLTVSSLIAGTLIPALSWATMTPEQWIAQVEQARNVRRLEWALKMEETTMRAYYARAVALLNAGISTLTIEQRKELAGILGGFARAQQQAMDQVAASWRQMYGVDVLMGTVNDQQIVDQYKQVADMLTEGGKHLSSTADYADDARALAPAHTDQTIDVRTAPRERHVTAHVDESDHVDSLSGSVQTRDAQPGRAVQSTATPHVNPRRAREDAEARQLWERLNRILPDVVMAKNVQAAMQWSSVDPAKRLITRWVDIGILEPTGPNRPGRYSRVEE